MRRFTLGVCGCGFAISALAFFALLAQPALVERGVRRTVVSVIERELTTRFPGVASLPQGVARLQHVLWRRSSDLDDASAKRRPLALAALLSRLCHYDCPDHALISAVLSDQLQEELAQLDHAMHRVDAWAGERYASLVRRVTAELRIFTGSNAVLYLLALSSSWRSWRSWRAGPRSRLLWSALLLTAATTSVGYCYLFDQHWLFSFVFSAYLGWAYLGWVLAVFVLLLDAAFFRAVLTRGAVSALGGFLDP